MDSNNISASEFNKRITEGVSLRVIDVREPIEFYSFNIGGLNIPLGKLADKLPLTEVAMDDEIIVLCKAGLRSRTARSILQRYGYTCVRNLTGGLIALQKIHQ